MKHTTLANECRCADFDRPAFASGPAAAAAEASAPSSYIAVVAMNLVWSGTQGTQGARTRSFEERPKDNVVSGRCMWVNDVQQRDAPWLNDVEQSDATGRATIPSMVSAGSTSHILKYDSSPAVGRPLAFCRMHLNHSRASTAAVTGVLVSPALRCFGDRRQCSNNTCRTIQRCNQAAL